MRKIQKVIIVIYGSLVAVACTYVPWITVVPAPNSTVPFSLGYSPIWKPLPVLSSRGVPLPNYSSVDIRRVILELIAITAISGVLFILTLWPKKVLPGS